MKKSTKSSEREAFKLIEEALRLMESRGLVEIELEHAGVRIHLKKGTAATPPEVVEYSPGAQPTAQRTEPGQIPGEVKGATIKSPMVGTFYRAPAPDAPPFVEVGQDVEVEQVVCIIEAMKLMNEIKSELAGRIVEVLVQNGDPIEFGQALFTVEPKI